MKKLNQFLIGIIIAFTIFGCNTNSKLSQENSEKAIKEFLNKKNEYFQINSIKEFGKINQFTDNEASTTVVFEESHTSLWTGDKTEEIQIKCIFKKNVDNKWMFTNIKPITHFNDWKGFYIWTKSVQDMNIIAQ